MGKCDLCGKQGETTDVTIVDKSDGTSRELDLCHECAVKSALAIKAGGGEVQFVDRTKKAGGGCASVFVALFVVGSLLYLLAT